MDYCEKLRLSQMVIDGKDPKDIAKVMDVHPATVYRVIADKDVKARIDHVRALIAEEAYEKSAQNVITAISEYQDPVATTKNEKGNVEVDKEGIMRREHGFKASVKVLESMGVLPSQSPSLFVQQIFNTQVNNNFISPLADKALEQAITGDLTEKEEDV